MAAYVYAYNQRSASGRALAEALGVRRISHERSRFRGNPTKTVINWGSSNLPENLEGSRIINQPEKIALASHKVRFFQTTAASDAPPRIPDFTLDSAEALRWIGGGHQVCIRSVLQGHSGEGLTIVDTNNLHEFVQAPLYTKYVPKKDEYRIHICNNEVISTQRKGLRQDEDRDGVDWRIRNHAGGFVYVRNDDRPVPDDVVIQSKLAFNAIGLDFGAVDVIYQENSNKAFVLEINTAPGLVGSTVQEYSQAIRNLIEGQN